MSVSQPAKDYIQKFRVRDDTLAHYDMHVTNSSLAFIKTQQGATGTGALWSAILGAAIYGRLTRKSYGDDMTLEKKLAAAKGSFEVQSDSIVGLTMGHHLGQYSLDLDFKNADGKPNTARIFMNRSDYDAFGKLMASLSAFAPKIKA
ncbi:MAG: hypothetical protein OK456_02840 [Thaumarchaeota archaeon]|nr:hypothetical protein [Nitrososphaerota archaeon]